MGEGRMGHCSTGRVKVLGADGAKRWKIIF
jgi:hypothetical protein